MQEEEDAVVPQAEPIEQVIDQHDNADYDSHEGNDGQHDEPQGHREKTMIPLSVAQKLREKKRELELELQWERQERQRLMQNHQAPQQPPEDDNSRYESATREDLKLSRAETLRELKEDLWISQNPEKAAYVDEHLPKLLKHKPHLAASLKLAQNRYEEAFSFMEAFNPRQAPQPTKKETGHSQPAPRREAPNSPGGVPKAAALNEAVDFMKMSDSEFNKWRQEQKANKRR